MDLSIVVVSWNTRALLSRCLESVHTNGGNTSFEVVVVDNGSTDGSQEMVRAEFRKARLIENVENVGFARANNQALPLCNGRYVMLLNSDSEVLPGALDTLLDFMDAHPEVATVGPQLIDPTGALKILTAGRLPSLRSVFLHYFFLSRLFPRIFRGVYLVPSQVGEEPVPVEWVTGACLLARRDVFVELGGLDESYFMYAEDMEFCQRVVRAGLSIYLVPAAKVIHRGGASGRDLSRERSTRWLVSLHELFARDRSRPAIIAFDLIHAAGLLIRAVLYAAWSLVRRGDAVHRKSREMWYSGITALTLARAVLRG